jgi:PAS domain S-box-containing protein
LIFPTTLQYSGNEVISLIGLDYLQHLHNAIGVVYIKRLAGYRDGKATANASHRVFNMKGNTTMTGWLRFFFKTFLFHLIFLSLAAPLAKADNRVVTVGIYENEPKVFTSKTGVPAGIFVDIIEHIAAKEGWDLHYLSGTWGEGLDRLAKGEIDLMPDVAYMTSREIMYTFHKVPALSSWFQVYALKGSKIQSILDLNKKRILVLERSIQQESFARLSKGFGLDISLLSVPDYKTMFEMVAKGEADAAITNRFYGMSHAKKFGLEDTAVLFEPSDLFFAATKKDPRHLLDAIDRHLLELKKDSQSIYYTSLKRWTSQSITFKLPLWLKIAGSAAVFVLIISLAGSAILKRQVNLRTQELRQTNQEMEQRITERTAELAAINKEQDTIFESAGVGIVVLRDRTIVRCNRKMEEIAGYAPGELAGQSTRIWYPDEETYETSGKEVYAQIAKGETHYLTQLMTRKDGTKYWARLSLRAFDQRDPLRGAVGIIEDITNEREAAEKLRQAMEAAQAADRIKSAFLATMSHELRTPLNSIIGFTGIMLQGLAGPLNEEQHKQMTMVQNSSRHLLSLINDVLDISKIEAGQLDLSLSSFEVRSSLEKMMRLISPLALQKGIDVQVDIAEDIGSLTTDQRRFEQVVLNLLNNAVKFTEKGNVQVACRIENDHCLLSITDTGIGMQPEELTGLFQPFHQIDTGLSRKHEGTGLGLSICKKLLDMMGGSVEVQSQWGQGSVFSVRLPRQAKERA